MEIWNRNRRSMIDTTIENYKNLLSAIQNSDIITKKKVICVYDTFDNERLIAMFNNTKSCADFFETSVNAIDCAVSRHQLRNFRYKIERLTIDIDTNKKI